MQDNWFSAGNTQSLNCTSNDVRLADVTNIVPGSGITTNPDGSFSCFEGTTVTFGAKFRVNLTAQARYDIGLYLAQQGQQTALSGVCSSSVITAGNSVPSTNFLQLDSSPDACGDIDATHNPQIIQIDAVTAVCTRDPATNKMLLPNCTSWRQPGSNGVCQTIKDAFPGSPSKCNCGTISIDITVDQLILDVQKAASPTQLYEPGGDVTYTVTVTNKSQVTTITLDKLTEDDTNDGVVDVTFDDAVTSVNKLTPICQTVTLAAGASTTCSFKRTVSGNAGDNITDKVCVGGHNSKPVDPVCATATVSIKDVYPTAAVTKSVNKATCATVEFGVKVENTDTVESLTLSALADDVFGDVASATNSKLVSTTCQVPQTIAASSNYTCSFQAQVCAPFPKTDVVTATLSDNDGNTIKQSGTATVTGVSVTSSP